ncbi:MULTISPECIES: tRNA (guanosine(18)-2'-O)-methyltransferase TrmH [Pseudoalteromonas]|uniref:tRNA (guanosine(18)-2'-O)-methyltransferase n=1 Tax=Pseudoalteromonas ruthenica TaxID=151081 RepID=A0A0F4Q2Q8_9GAMM|nr:MULTISPECIES: tRNA (guanosine(18)-2'-O)-methyltransferase TrmH [Pseudoalteromonas]KJY97951.1 tRNA guanosine-2'-O-methyltransferase [Pseudoalteromonas ruthenica]KJZ01976.1 tRNA guanosine-2'-O-methyltransferase [Pseudoalteromonas ruthenica]MCF2862881.1 tRNA (guanosine(18)-2'-O)-methyltransferase TrmH [Pseudoalteromonas sp. CNAT2-18]MCG7543470.1 tRNA (guanosine(18)-2'-O)-methyltransferase TrmH [Pseudoalteromonas sp. MM17-2]MCG7558667.1 tRNA (guanosine(18)-2'-O)-methyltransferase TrmH [Pseudoal|tara:strand:+ start:1027 stop:1722 length:696 start_codon:yes stop_codon:yes gene_type:complete
MGEKRYHRVKQVLDRRQTDLSVCLDEVHKHHNLSAIVRTADAVGCHHIHAVWPKEQRRLTNNTSGGSKNWVHTHMHDDIDQAVGSIREQIPGVQLLATNLSSDAVDYRDIDYTQPTAVIVGQEREGISDAALAHADKHIVIPMRGMVQSLNVSVAAALILYEAQRQREAAGLYERDMLNPQIKHTLLFEGCHPIIAQQCKEKGLPYPALDENGEIIANEQFWDTLRYKRQR